MQAYAIKTKCSMWLSKNRHKLLRKFRYVNAHNAIVFFFFTIKVHERRSLSLFDV